jgi:hypothetical protein
MTHTFSRTPLDEGSACRRYFYLATRNIHKRQISTPPAAFEPTIPESELPQTYALNAAAAGVSYVVLIRI